jgi:transcriptional regulator with XRE-family HTH domain
MYPEFMPKFASSPAYQAAISLLVLLRKERGVSQEQLAERLGKKQPFVSLVERRERRLDVVEYYAFAKAIGADPEEVFSRLVAMMPVKVEI